MRTVVRHIAVLSASREILSVLKLGLGLRLSRRLSRLRWNSPEGLLWLSFSCSLRGRNIDRLFLLSSKSLAGRRCPWIIHLVLRRLALHSVDVVMGGVLALIGRLLSRRLRLKGRDGDSSAHGSSHFSKTNWSVWDSLGRWSQRSR